MFRRLKHYLTEGFPLRSEYNPGFRGFVLFLQDILDKMPPGMSRLMKLQPVLALTTSLLCILLLRRGFEHVPMVIVFILFSFFFLTFRLKVGKKGGMLPKVWDMALLYMVNDMLIFVIPFYFDSITFPSRNMFFAPIVIGMVVLANWYQLYQRFIQPYPLAGSIFYSLTFFCVLNFLLPVVFGMRNIWSLLISGAIATVSVPIFVYPHVPVLKNWKNSLLMLTGSALFMCLVWFGRSAVPPVPLLLVSATACEGVEDLAPVNPYSSKNIDDQDVYFFTSIFAPRGLSEKVLHVWYRNGHRLLAIDVSEIRGGRKQGFRTWSRHAVSEGPGSYSVEVWTAGGQLLGAKGFRLR